MKLSPRQRDVAMGILEGKTNQEIANSLGIVKRTVECHIATVFAKLNIHSRRALVSWAVDREA